MCPHDALTTFDSVPTKSRIPLKFYFFLVQIKFDPTALTEELVVTHVIAV